MAKIMVVDDEANIRKLVETTLTNRGHEVVTAESGREALGMVKVVQPDLIVLDVIMPGMSGHEVREALAADEETADIPVLHLTAVGDFTEQLDSLESGAASYVTKPFAPSDLANTIDGILDPSSADTATREKTQQETKLRTIVEVMRRKQEDEGS
jgi:DNA-binding response OmpR family regulator